MLSFLGDYTTRKFWKYALRWEASSLILAPMMYLPGLPNWAKVILANFVGAVIFFKVDKRIFRHKQPRARE